MATLTQQQHDALNTKDEIFIKELGARIATARKEHNLTQTELAV